MLFIKDQICCTELKTNTHTPKQTNKNKKNPKPTTKTNQKNPFAFQACAGVEGRATCLILFCICPHGSQKLLFGLMFQVNLTVEKPKPNNNTRTTNKSTNTKLVDTLKGGVQVQSLFISNRRVLTSL